MASCFITTGYTLDCRTSSTGGLKTLWILGGASNSITGYTVTNSQVSAIGGTGTWFNFQLPKQAASLTENLGVNTTSQSVTFQPELVVNLPKLDTNLRDVFVDLVSQNEIYALVEDNNNRYWLVFLDNGGLVTAGSLATGQLYTDLNGASALTIGGGEPTSIREVLVTTTIQAVFTAGGFTFQP
jgi:hypothetical protein